MKDQAASGAAKLAGLESAQLFALLEKVCREGSWTNAHIAGFWLANVELTKRGIAPRFRGLPEPGYRPAYTLTVEDESGELDAGSKLHILLRWVDMQWLVTRFPCHLPKIDAWRDVFFATELDWNRVEPIVLQKLSPGHIADGLGLTDEMRLGLHVLTNTATRDAHEVAERTVTRLQKKLKRLVEVGKLTEEEARNRRMQCRALRIARGAPELAARLYGQMAGRTITRQSMHEIRGKLERLGVNFHPPENRKVKPSAPSPRRRKVPLPTVSDGT